jgi:Bacteriophage HK97-gp10, putative tail-component
MINVEIKADPSIQRALATAQMGPLRKMLRKSTRAGAKPMLAAIKAATPVKSGKLRASWGLSPFFDGRTGSVGVTIEPRSSFSFSDSEGNKRLVTNRGRAHKSVVAATAKGKTVDRDSAWKYAFGIETGHSPKGRMSRHAGGAKMLERSVRPGADPFTTTINDDVRKHIAAAV